MDCFAALAMTVSARWHSTPHSHISRHRPPTGPRNARPDDRLRRNPPSRRRPEHHAIDHGSGEAALHGITGRVPALPAAHRDDTRTTDRPRWSEAPAPRSGSDRTRMDTWCGSGIRWAG